MDTTSTKSTRGHVAAFAHATANNDPARAAVLTAPIRHLSSLEREGIALAHTALVGRFGLTIISDAIAEFAGWSRCRRAYTAPEQVAKFIELFAGAPPRPGRSALLAARHRELARLESRAAETGKRADVARAAAFRESVARVEQGL